MGDSFLDSLAPFIIFRGHATQVRLPDVLSGYPLHRKTGKMDKKIPVRENIGNLEILPKHRENTGIWFAQVINSLILKAKYISKFTAKISQFIF